MIVAHTPPHRLAGAIVSPGKTVVHDLIKGAATDAMCYMGSPGNKSVFGVPKGTVQGMEGMLVEKVGHMLL